MYLDPKGNVTVGVGLMLPTVQAAQALPFWAGEYKASAAAIAADYNRVKASTPGFIAAYYQWVMSCTLKDDDISALTRNIVTANVASLTHRFNQFSFFPAPAKLALLDMAYNLGVIRLLQEYPKLSAAVDAQQWMSCAAECGRDTNLPEFARRNDWTRAQFRQASYASAAPVTSVA